jgi:hypothetical protein
MTLLATYLTRRVRVATSCHRDGRLVLSDLVAQHSISNDSSLSHVEIQMSSMVEWSVEIGHGRPRKVMKQRKEQGHARDDEAVNDDDL